MGNKMKTRKEQREEKKELKRESKRKQESVLSDLAQFMEDVHKTVDTEDEDIEQIEDFAGFVQEESTVAGRALADIIYTFTNDFEIGKLVKSGEIRKKVVGVEPEWKVPELYNMTHFDLKNFSMKLLTRSRNPKMNFIMKRG